VSDSSPAERRAHRHQLLFDGALDLGDAQTRSIELAACRAMALNIWTIRVDGGLDLYGLMCGAIVLGNSRIAGDLRLDRG